MGRQAFFFIFFLWLTTSLAGATGGSESPLTLQQQPPVYLKSLTSAREKEAEESEDIDSDVLIDATLNRIGRAFSTGDPDELEACLVTGKRKIYLALEADGSQHGHYGPSQVRHIFGRLFRDVDTRDFLYDSRELERYSRRAVLHAEWTYVVLETDEVVTERLQFKLELDETDWRLYEIRATAR